MPTGVASTLGVLSSLPREAEVTVVVGLSFGWPMEPAVDDRLTERTTAFRALRVHLSKGRVRVDTSAFEDSLYTPQDGKSFFVVPWPRQVENVLNEAVMLSGCAVLDTLGGWLKGEAQQPQRVECENLMVACVLAALVWGVWERERAPEVGEQVLSLLLVYHWEVDEATPVMRLARAGDVVCGWKSRGKKGRGSGGGAQAAGFVLPPPIEGYTGQERAVTSLGFPRDSLARYGGLTLVERCLNRRDEYWALVNRVLEVVFPREVGREQKTVQQGFDTA